MGSVLGQHRRPGPAIPKEAPEDITKIMESQRWKLEKMFKEAEEFFTSLGLLSPSPEFWK